MQLNNRFSCCRTMGRVLNHRPEIDTTSACMGSNEPSRELTEIIKSPTIDLPQFCHSRYFKRRQIQHKSSCSGNLLILLRVASMPTAERPSDWICLNKICAEASKSFRCYSSAKSSHRRAAHYTHRFAIEPYAAKLRSSVQIKSGELLPMVLFACKTCGHNRN